MGNFKKVISLHQASILSGYHQDYLSSLIRKNEIRGEKKGSNWFTTEQEIQTYIFKQRIRNKNGVAKSVLLFVKKINRSFLYALICLVLFVVGLYFYNKITDAPKIKQFIPVTQSVPEEENSNFQF